MLPADPVESARIAGLRHVDTNKPGIRRELRGEEFVYFDKDGNAVRDEAELQRIRSLAIPPAWKNVWICPHSKGHIQAIGWDARGRKQYRYHALYRHIRDLTKFHRLTTFMETLPAIRARVEQDLSLPGLPKAKVLATIVRLLETTFIRVGNEEYAKENGSFGLTTLRNRHVQIKGRTLMFSFRGKSGLEHRIELTDRKLARIIRQCQELPGYELFEYVDDNGEIATVDSEAVNEYLQEVAGGQDFTAKDFRTWAGTMLMARALALCGSCETITAAKKAIVEAVKQVAVQLGNRPATCRKYYVHPAIVDSFQNGSLLQIMQGVSESQKEALTGTLAQEEKCVLRIVKEFLKREIEGSAGTLKLTPAA